MSPSRIAVLTTLAILAISGNSMLCRIALKSTGIDAATFTTVRLLSGAMMLGLLLRVRGATAGEGNWTSALALFAYAAAFSFAYVNLPLATGALLLFGAVQVTMIGHGIWAGERLRALQMAGLALAAGGLIALLLPGLSAPPLFGSLLMLLSGVAWGIYSLRGRGAGDPTAVTAGNFMRAAPMTVVLSAFMHAQFVLDNAGIWYAMISGALTSALGYIVWYAVLPKLKSSQAATVQLSVPVVVAIGGIVFLGESLSARVVVASVTILGGVALVMLNKQSPPSARPAGDCSLHT